jgi:hypothetical protein
MKPQKVKVVDTDGLDAETINMIEPIMTYTNDYEESGDMFVELHNSKGQIIRIFPERIEKVI